MVRLTKKQLSDIFFGHYKANYQEASNKEYETLDEAENAIQSGLQKDAAAFAEMISNQVKPEWLVKEFNRRVQDGETTMP